MPTGSTTWISGGPAWIPRRGEPVRRVDREEAVVLEERERRERRHDGDRHHQSPAERVLLLRHGEPADLRHQADAREQPHEMPVPPRVEDVARADHEQLPRQGPRVQEPVSEEHQAEEDREVDGGEEHRPQNSRAGGRPPSAMRTGEPRRDQSSVSSDATGSSASGLGMGSEGSDGRGSGGRGSGGSGGRGGERRQARDRDRRHARDRKRDLGRQRRKGQRDR